jgi:hypothetical protein
MGSNPATPIGIERVRPPPSRDVPQPQAHTRVAAITTAPFDHRDQLALALSDPPLDFLGCL